MDPPPPPRGIGVPLHPQSSSARGSLLSAPGTTMANPAISARPPTSNVYTTVHDLKAATEEPVPVRPPTEAMRSSGGDVIRQLVMQLNDTMAASLRQVAVQYGVEDVLANEPSTNAHEVVHELQTARRKAAELQLLVNDLQTEQRVARERLALYSILALKLKRELINEKLAHIDSKKEVDEIRQQYEGGGGGGSVGTRSPEAPSRLPSQTTRGGQRRGSYESLRGTHSADEDDPWSSPNKPTGDAAAFSSFYSSRQMTGSQEPTSMGVDEDDERMLGMQPLRNSLLGQFLPSALLDSPQLSPKARSVESGPRSLDNQDDEGDETKSTGEELDRELSSFALHEMETAKEGGCDGCGRPQTLVELMDCGHRLCRPCEQTMPVVDEPTSLAQSHQCPRCFKSVTSLRRLDTTGDNQKDHLQIETSDSTASALSVMTATPTLTVSTSVPLIAPLTLSLLSEMFENISVEELELFLKDANGQVSGAIERILQQHPSFNPALAAEVSVTAGPGVGASGQKGATGAGSLHRSSSGLQQQSQQQSASGTSGNWKTEMCMYYLQGKCNKTRRTCSFAHGESDLVRINTPKHTSSTSYKSRMCPLWLEGSCPKSRRECPLAHGENDLRDGLALLSQNTGGAGGAGAATIPAPTLPTTAPRLQNYKTELCYYYLKGCCNFTKEECRFAHGESDLRTVESNTLEWSAQLGAAAGLTADKASMQHQYQQQQPFVQPYQPQQPQQPPQQPAMRPQYGLTPLPAPFVPQAHQYHQMSPQPMHQMPPALPQGPYGAPPPQYRYMKSMDDAKPPRRPAPPRRESTWSHPSYESMGGDF